ncbi:MAG: hypothetical protein NTW28_30535 [Candidatus Solibacter sp.]|nr:hypothetical protein [Candidatus Solibacter sp.]
MKYYWCVLPLAVCVPQAWGADTGRVPYHVEAVAGSSRIGDGGPALAAQFSNVQGIAIDRLGNLYLSDTDNHRVRKVSGGVVTTIAGTGVAGWNGDGKSALNAQLNFPYGLALDAAGNVYVADLGNRRVRRISPEGAIVTVAGTGRKASSPDGAAPTDTSLLSPRNVAVDAAGNLYIAEFEGHRVRKLTPDGKLSTVTGTGVAGWSGDGRPAPTAQINYPAGMAFDRAGALYLADSGNNAVRKLNADGSIGTVLGRNPGTTLYTPLAVAVDPAGTLYVGDSTFVVRAFTTAGRWISYAGTGVPSFSGDGTSALNAALNSVNDLAADLNGNLFIADGVRLRRVDPSGGIVSVAGDGYLHSVGDGGPAAMAQFYQPSALTLDSAGNLYIADSGTARVRQVLRGGTVTTLAGNGTAARGAADGSPATNVALNTPPCPAGYTGADHAHGSGHRDKWRQPGRHPATGGAVAWTARRVHGPHRQSVHCGHQQPPRPALAPRRVATNGRRQRVQRQRRRRRRCAPGAVGHTQRLRHRFRRQPLYRRHRQPHHS